MHTVNPKHILPQLLLRAWPFPRGAGRLADKFFSGISFTEDTVTVRTTDGFPITVIPNELIGRHIYLTGEFDRTTVEVICNLAKPGDTLLDIGANIGYVSACFLSLVPDSQVVALDPQPGVVDLLRTNLAQFESRQKVFPVALSDRDATMHFYVDARNRGASKIVERGDKNTVAVEVWSASSLIERAKIEKVDIIKIDVEGHEQQVISALIPALNRFQPRAILFEDHGNKAAPSQPIGALLRAAGYRIEGIKKRLTKIDMIPIETEADCICNDYVALR